MVLTRFAAPFRPVKDRWNWPGMSVPLADIVGVAQGHTSLGNRTFATLELQIGSTAVSRTVVTGKRGLNVTLQAGGQAHLAHRCQRPGVHAEQGPGACSARS